MIRRGVRWSSVAGGTTCRVCEPGSRGVSQPIPRELGRGPGERAEQRRIQDGEQQLRAESVQRWRRNHKPPERVSEHPRRPQRRHVTGWVPESAATVGCGGMGIRVRMEGRGRGGESRSLRQRER